MKKILLLVTFSICSKYGNAQPPQSSQAPQTVQAPCVEANIIILNDMSSSLTGNEDNGFFLIQSFFFGLPIAQDQVWLGLATFGDTCRICLRPTGSSEEVSTHLNDLFQQKANESSTNLGIELLTMPYYFTDAAVRRGKVVRNILVIISDGYFSSSSATVTYANILKEEYGIEIFTILYNSILYDDAYLSQIVSDRTHCAFDDPDPALKIINARSMCQ